MRVRGIILVSLFATCVTLVVIQISMPLARIRRPGGEAAELLAWSMQYRRLTRPENSTRKKDLVMAELVHSTGPEFASLRSKHGSMEIGSLRDNVSLPSRKSGSRAQDEPHGTALSPATAQVGTTAGKSNVSSAARCISSPAGFLWDLPTPLIWAEISQTAVPIQGPALPVPSRPEFQDAVLAGLAADHRDHYKAFAASMKTPNGSWEHTLVGPRALEGRLRIATFQDVLCTPNGWIIDTKTCSYVGNGGCVDTVQPDVPDTVPVYDHVVTIATKWADKTWHFPMEVLVGLAALPNDMWSNEDTVLHVGALTPWVLEWLRIVGVPKRRVATGTLVAKVLMAPEMARCGSPLGPHIRWLRLNVAKQLGTLNGPMQSRRSLVLVKRTKSRRLRNFEAVNQTVQASSNKLGLSVYLHDDSNMPKLQEQLARFAEASVVVAQHGAGLLNLIAVASDTIVVEFIDAARPNVCYARLSVMQGNSYHAVAYFRRRVDIRMLKMVLSLVRL